MARIYTPAIRALVVATLVAATAALLHVAVQTARAAGVSSGGTRAGYGAVYDVGSAIATRRMAFGRAAAAPLRACDLVSTIDCIARFGANG